jgi:murein DD-endopeptidase MepM/ murein hydrolase activator NlpD
LGFAPVENASPALSVHEEQAVRFAIDSGSVLRVESGLVGKGQSLSHILSPKRVNTGVLHRIATEDRDIFDVRNIRAGKEWHLFRDGDSSVPRFFAYAISDREYVVFDLSDEGSGRRGEFPVETRRGFAEGAVKGSLYQALENAGHSPNLALAMASVYAWTIDFSRIQSGDQFRILYERDWVDDSPVGMPRILAADFVHRGRNFPAFLFDQGDGSDYFDETGASLRKAFLKAPVEFSRISSRFNKKRFHPVLKKVKAHLGTDYAAAHGTPIIAVGDGVVTKASYTKGNGKYVKIRHNGTYTTQYLHMSRRKAKEGQAVRQGDVIGYVGSTGLATGPHVCFRFWKNGVQVDHLREEFPPSTPIREDQNGVFADAVATWLDEMARRSASEGPRLASNAP